MVIGMLSFISGKVAECGSNNIVVENHGIGYDIAFAHPEKLKLADDVKIYIYLHIREDEMSLFGFSSQEEKNLFMKLISVKGLGPKTAMGILGATTLDSLFNAIEQGDVAFMKKMPGIGAKTASQIVLDLQGKLVPVEKKEAGLSSELSDALEALKALGYKPAEVAKIRSKLSETPGLSTDEYLKMGVAMMMKL